MAKYNDISKTNTEGWHIITQSESVVKSNSKKHKKCRFLNEEQTCSNTGSSYYQQLCIGKVHCSSYIPPFTEKQTVLKKTNNKKSKSVPIPKVEVPTYETKEEYRYNKNANIVSYGDTVTLYCFEDDEYMEIKLKANLNVMPPIQKECLNMEIGSTFTLSDYTYKITDILKINNG